MKNNPCPQIADDLWQGSVNFCEEPDGKYFRICGTLKISVAYSSFNQLCKENAKTILEGYTKRVNGSD